MASDTESPAYLHQYACELFESGDVTGARRVLERVLFLHDEIQHGSVGETVIILKNLAFMCSLQSDFTSAEDFLDRAQVLWEFMGGGEDHMLAEILNDRGSALKSIGKLGAAEDTFERALRVSEQLPDRDDFAVASILSNLASLDQDDGFLDSARQTFERAWEICESSDDVDDLTRIDILEKLASVHQQQGDLDRARITYELALAYTENLPGPHDARLAVILSKLASVVQEDGGVHIAQSLFARALAIYEASLGVEHSDTQAIQKKLAQLEEQVVDAGQNKHNGISELEIKKKIDGNLIYVDFRKKVSNIRSAFYNTILGDGPMGPNETKKITRLIERSGLTVEQLQQAIDLWKTTSGGVTARAKSAKTKSPPTLAKRKVILTKTAELPSLPKGLKWPKLHYDKSPQFQKRGGIIQHLDKVWRPLIEAKAVDMSVLRAFYPSTAEGIDRLRKRGGKLPDDLDIPLVQPGSGRRKITPPPKLAAG